MKFKRGTATLAVSAIALLAAGSAASALHLWQGPPPAPPAASGSVQVASNSAQLSGSKGYHDGSFVGPAVYQYYGYVQTRVNIQNGKIASIDILQYPSDYRTSVYINTHALPMLESEVVQSQTTRISGISGATLTSEAFVMSTQAALNQATG